MLLDPSYKLSCKFLFVRLLSLLISEAGRDGVKKKNQNYLGCTFARETRLGKNKAPSQRLFVGQLLLIPCSYKRFLIKSPMFLMYLVLPLVAISIIHIVSSVCRHFTKNERVCSLLKWITVQKMIVGRPQKKEEIKAGINRRIWDYCSCILWFNGSRINWVSMTTTQASVKAYWLDLHLSGLEPLGTIWTKLDILKHLWFQ